MPPKIAIPIRAIPPMPPALRFNDGGESDRLPSPLAEAARRALSEYEAKTVADALASRQPCLEWTGRREKVDPAPPSESPQDCWID